MPLISGPSHVLFTLPGTLHLCYSGLSLDITFTREAATNPTLWIYARSTLWAFFPNLPEAQCCELQNGHSNTDTAGLLWGKKSQGS